VCLPRFEPGTFRIQVRGVTARVKSLDRYIRESLSNYVYLRKRLGTQRVLRRRLVELLLGAIRFVSRHVAVINQDSRNADRDVGDIQQTPL
jgi:hypothetical protein